MNDVVSSRISVALADRGPTSLQIASAAELDKAVEESVRTALGGEG